MEWIRFLRIRCTIHETKSTHSNHAAKIVQQFGLLAVLPNLTSIDLGISFDGRQTLCNVRPSLAIIERALQSLRTSRPSIHILLSISELSYVAVQLAQACSVQVLPVLLKPLVGTSVEEFELAGCQLEFPINSQFCLTEAYTTFRDLVASIRRFKVTGLAWPLICPEPPAMPTLERLELTCAVGREPETLGQIVGFINRVAAQLKRLRIHFWDDMDEMTDAVVDLQPLICPSLTCLRLYGAGLGLLATALSDLPCRRLDVHMSWSSDWWKLLALLRDKQCLRGANTVNLTVGTDRDVWYPSAAPSFRQISAAAKARKLDLRVYYTAETEGDPITAPVQDLLEMLVRMSRHLITLHCNLYDVPFNPFAVYTRAAAVNLTRCKEMEWFFWDQLHSDHPGSGDQAFAAIFAVINAPVLGALKLDIGSAFTEHLSALTAAINRGAFPQLNSIEGTLRGSTDNQGLLTYDDGAPRELRKQALIDICRSHGISLEKLRWM